MYNEKAKQEYERILGEGKTDLRLLDHPGFKSCFERLFYDERDYTISSNGTAMYISRSIDFPEHTNGFYKGVSNEDKICFSLEKIGESEYLVFEKKSGSIYNFENYDGTLKASGSVTVDVYDQIGDEFAYINFQTGDRLVQKGHSPLVGIGDFIPNFNLEQLLSGSDLCGPTVTNNRVFDNIDWQLFATRRMSNHPTITEEIDFQRTASSGVNKVYKFGYVNQSENSYRIAGNTTLLAYNENGRGLYSMNDGRLLSQEDLMHMLDNYDNRDKRSAGK